MTLLNHPANPRYVMQHKYELALECNCLNHDDLLGPADARVFLYKVVVKPLVRINTIIYQKFYDNPVLIIPNEYFRIFFQK